MSTDHTPLTGDELEELSDHIEGFIEYGEIEALVDDAPKLARLVAEATRLRTANIRLAARVDQIEHGIQGTCPSCHHQSLTINDRGWLTCHWSTCEHPDAAALLLTDPPAAAELAEPEARTNEP